MAIFEDFVTAVRRTEPIQALLKSLDEEPARLLATICREYEATGKAVPDHHLHLAGYFAETSLRALISASLVTKEPGERLSLYSYKPTETGVKYYEGMLREGRI
jgi:hypothetical protein